MKLTVTQAGVADAQQVIKWVKEERQRMQHQLRATDVDLMKLPKEELVRLLHGTTERYDATLVTLLQTMEIFS